MITLDRAQSATLIRAATVNVLVRGGDGTGKSSLANAIAVEAAQAGLTCLLVGASPELEKPLEYRTASPCHPLLAKRAEVGSDPIVLRQQIDPLRARARLDPTAFHRAQLLSQRGRELAEQYGLDPDEVENGVLTAWQSNPEAVDLLTVIIQDATRVADILWSGNRRSGRSLHDIETVLSGGSTDVPPDEATTELIVADDDRFEANLLAALTAARQNEEEDHLAAVVAGLQNPAPADKTFKELDEHIERTTHFFRDAIQLVKNNTTINEALKVEPGSRAGRLVEYFVRKHPGEGKSGIINRLDEMMRLFDNDRAALAPYLQRHGSRLVGSVVPGKAETRSPLPPDGSIAVQEVREGHHAARHLPGRMAQLHLMLPAPVLADIATAPIEDIEKRFDAAAASDERIKAAQELRNLRDLFASTGFGDLFKAPSDFAEWSAGGKNQTLQAGTSHSSKILDLLVDINEPVAVRNSAKLKLWPSSVIRVRSQTELDDVASRGSKFDVVVADDADRFDHSTLDRFASTGTRVHRIAATISGEAIDLGTHHRQTNYQLADLASRRHGYWLAGPGGLGVVVREISDSELDVLEANAAALAISLTRLGRNAALAADRTIANIIIAALDQLTDGRLQSLAKYAREGIVVLCRRDLRRLPSMPDRTLPEDAITARSLGWQIKRKCEEGVVLEKNGKAVAIVDEPVALTGYEDLVTDVVARSSALGWHPLVAWRGSPRDPNDLALLLESHSVPSALDDPLRAIVKKLDLSRSDRLTLDTKHGFDSELSGDSDDWPKVSNSPSLTMDQPTQIASTGGDAGTALTSPAARPRIIGISQLQPKEASSPRVLSIAISPADEVPEHVAKIVPQEKKIPPWTTPESSTPHPESSAGIPKHLQGT